ncbi:MAG: nucleotide sugar dehydrogenase [Candidatus Norongarragalinales archaeon]
MLKELEKKIADKSAVVAFVGLGKMGLPSALKTAESGFRVIGIDVDKRVVSALRRLRSPYVEPGVEEALKKNKARFRATTDYDALREADVIICIVPTTITRQKQVDYSIVENAFRKIAERLKRGALVVFSSNVTPGVTEELVLPLLERVRKFKHERDFLLAYAPIQGKAGQMFRDLDSYAKVVAGVTPKARHAAALFFKQSGYKVKLATSCKVAELEKIFANIFKDVNIAVANELAAYCEKQGLGASEVREVIRFVNEVPGIRLLEPGIGVGGNCLPVDPYFYLSHSRKIGACVRLPKIAREINDSRPSEFARRIAAEARRRKAKKIILLGAAFRPNTHETAYSPAVEVCKELERMRWNVSVFDPLVGKARLKQLGLKPAGKAEVRKAVKANSLKSPPNASVFIVKLVNHAVFKKFAAAVDAEKL